MAEPTPKELATSSTSPAVDGQAITSVPDVSNLTIADPNPASEATPASTNTATQADKVVESTEPLQESPSPASNTSDAEEKVAPVAPVEEQTATPTPTTALTELLSQEVATSAPTTVVPIEKVMEQVPAQVPEVPSVAEVTPTQPAVVESSNEVKPTQDTEDVEPTNTLTERFTELEWTALREFRTQLPDIFADAFPDDAKARDTPITIWNVVIDPLNPKKDARVSVVLVKFLRARNLSVRDARDMLNSTLRWRKSFDIDALMKEEFPQDVFGNVGHIFGQDKQGQPVIYNVYGGNEDLGAVFGDVQRFVRWRVQLMERSVNLLDFNTVDQTLQVHDYEGVNMFSRDANSKNAASEATSIFQAHYPELLYKKFFVNVPTIMNWIFWAFKPLISAKTLAKMSVVGTGHHAIKKALSPDIDASQLPERYGGEAKAF